MLKGRTADLAKVADLSRRPGQLFRPGRCARGCRVARSVADAQLDAVRYPLWAQRGVRMTRA